MSQAAPAGSHHIVLGVITGCDQHPVFRQHFIDISGDFIGTDLTVTFQVGRRKVLSGACTVVEVTGTRGTAGVWVATGALTCVAPTAAAASANNLSTRSMVWIRNFPVDLISLVCVLFSVC